MQDFNVQIWLEKAKALARQDPRKTTVLAVLAVVLLVVVGRLLAGNGLPNRAVAETVRPTIRSTALAGLGTASSSDSPSPAQLAADQKIRAHNLADRQRAWMTEPPRPITRNLFALQLDYFPRDGTHTPQTGKSPLDGAFWGSLEKSLMLQADQKDKRQNQLANYRDEAQKLRLDSIVMGEQPKAMINGKLLAEGDSVESFRVLKIEARRLIVERDGIRLEIAMK